MKKKSSNGQLSDSDLWRKQVKKSYDKWKKQEELANTPPSPPPVSLFDKFERVWHSLLATATIICISVTAGVGLHYLNHNIITSLSFSSFITFYLVFVHNYFEVKIK